MKNLSNLLDQQESRWKQAPRPLRIFLLRGVCILIVWKCLYLFLIRPWHGLDAMLTLDTAQATAWLFHLFSPQMQPQLIPQRDVLITALVNGKRINTISIADACNALELLVLHIGFILSVPVPFRKQLPYIGAGILLIIAANVLRCLALIYIYIAFPNFFPFAHHYIFTLLIYLIIFLTWRLFIKYWIRYETR
jgi:exosortase/archaeosortase family protein